MESNISGLVSWTWWILLVVKESQKLERLGIDLKKLLKLTSLYLLYAKLSQHLLIQKRPMFLTETLSLQGFSKILLEEIQKHWWSQMLVQQITIMMKQWIHWDMQVEPKILKTSQKLMKIQKMLCLENIKMKSLNWENS